MKGAAMGDSDDPLPITPEEAWKLVPELQKMGERELPIVVLAWLDDMLSERLAQRLHDPGEDGIRKFLDSELATLRRRLHLGLVVGLIPRPLAKMLQHLGEVRNHAAHRSRDAGLDGPKPLKKLRKMLGALVAYMKYLSRGKTATAEFEAVVAGLEARLPRDVEARRDAIIICYVMVLSHLQRMERAMKRIIALAEPQWDYRQNGD